MQKPQPIYRKDYKPVDYTVDTVSLVFKLDEEFTLVSCEQRMVPSTPGDPSWLARQPIESIHSSATRWRSQPLTARPSPAASSALPPCRR